MKLAIALAAVMGLALAPAAAAQATCSQINTVTEAAADDFDSILDDESDEEAIYETSFWLARAGDCFIDLFEDSIYSCSYDYSTQAAASAAFDTQNAIVGACIAATWAPSALPAQDEFKGQTRRLRGTVYEGAGEHIDMGWSVSLEEFAGDTGTSYKVWVEMVYLLW
jgi:hypothetical protein